MEKSSQKFGRIIQIAFEIANSHISEGGMKFDNEASFQLFFSNILLDVARLSYIGKNRRFEVELEKIIKLDNPTPKTQNEEARCDIRCKLADVANKDADSFCYIELKYFPENSDTVTDKRKSVYLDIKNLESYMYDGTGKKKNGIAACYMILVAEDEKFRAKGTHKFTISEGMNISSQDSINLRESYLCEWQGKMLKIKI